MRPRNADLVGVAVVTAAGCFYAAATIAVKLAYRFDAGTGLVTWIRFAMSALVLWALVRALRVRVRLGRGRLRSLAGMGIVSSFVGGLFVGSLDRIPAATATLLLYTHPAMVALATATLRREQWSLGKGLALVLSMLGVVLVLGAPAGELDWGGVGMALGAAVALAAFVVLAQRAVVAVHPLVSSGVVQVSAALAFGPVALATGSLHAGRDPTSVAWMIAGGLFTAGAISLFLAAVGRLGPTRASIGATVEPVVTVILGVLVLSEGVRALQLLGGLLVVAAVAILPLVERKAVAAGESPH